MYKGQPLERTDGPAKVRGEARYAGENFPAGMVYAYAFTSTIPAGEVTSFDLSEAAALEGVLGILTHQNAPRVPAPDPKKSRQMRPIPALQDGKVHKFGQYLGVVVAKTFEVAREGARRVGVSYAPGAPRLDFDEHFPAGKKPQQMMGDADSARGDFDSAFAASEVKVDAVYETPVEHHHPMEPHVIIAAWVGKRLECYASSQGPFGNVGSLAATFKLPLSDVRVQSLYVGGGFGSKGASWEHMAIAAMAARLVKRPVKFTVTRQQMVYNTGLRQHNRQHVRLGASREGKLEALAHETTTFHAMTSEFVEPAGAMSRMQYEHPHSRVTHRAVEMHLPTPWYTRAPGETPGSFALECALDELAVAAGIDPVQLRLVNEPARNPHDGKPWSSRLLAECVRTGAHQFGWGLGGGRRDGDWLIGYGMSTAARGAPMRESQARIRVKRSGGAVKALVELAATDIGTGSYTILLQTACDGLGLPPAAVKVRIGDSAYPEAPASTGSVGAASFCQAVHAAALQLRAELAALSGLPATSPLASLLRKESHETTVREGPGEEREKHALYSFGANFAEVGVDVELGLVRVRRLHTVAAAGKILNPRLARSQMLGGMVWGLGAALTERSPHDTRHGNFLARDLANYHVPVNRDVGLMSVHFLMEEDRVANDLGVKGLGELGIIGVAAAIANAVFNACGKRIRRLPIRPADFMQV